MRALPPPEKCASWQTRFIRVFSFGQRKPSRTCSGIVRTILLIFISLATSLTAQVRFVPNQGQWPEHVQHRAEVVSGGLQVDADGWTSWQWAPSESGDHHAGKKQGVLWQARWKHAEVSQHEDWVTSETDTDELHFYLSSDPEHWAEHVQAARRIERDNLWPGISLRWRGTRNGNAKFEFTVSPGADPSLVGWEYSARILSCAVAVGPGSALEGIRVASRRARARVVGTIIQLYNNTIIQ